MTANKGRHQWIVVAVYGLTDAEVGTDAEVRLDSEHRLSVEGPGCYNCEHPWSKELAAKPCPAPWDPLTPSKNRVRQT